MAVFKQIYIPRTLAEVDKFEEDFDKMQKGQGQDIAYSTVTGLKPDLSGAQSVPELLKNRAETGVIVERGREECVNSKEESSGDESKEDDSSSEEVEEREGEEGGKATTYVHPRGHKKGGRCDCCSVLKSN